MLWVSVFPCAVPDIDHRAPIIATKLFVSVEYMCVCRSFEPLALSRRAGWFSLKLPLAQKDNFSLAFFCRRSKFSHLIVRIIDL